MVVERLLVDLEQLVARVGAEDRQQRLAVVAVGIEAGPLHDGVDAAAQQRHVGDHRVVGRRGEQADEAALAGDAAIGVVGLDDHAVHRPEAMDQRGPVGLDDQDVVRPAREAGHRRPAAPPGVEQPDLVAPQQAERGAGHQLVAQPARLQRVLDVAVVAVAEEREVVGLEPAQELLVLGEVGRAAGREVGDGVEAGLAHRPPVLDRQPHLGQHAGQRGGQLVELVGVALAVDLDVHHRFRAGPLARFEREAGQVAVEVAPHRQHRVGQQVDRDFAAIERVGDRIDEERHVVVDDLHDGVAAHEAVVGGRVEDPHLGDAGQPAAGEGEQGDRRAGPLVDRGGGEVLVGDPAEQAAGDLRGLLAAGRQGGGTDGVEAIDAWGHRTGHGDVALRTALQGEWMLRPTMTKRRRRMTRPEVPAAPRVLQGASSTPGRIAADSVAAPRIPRQSAFCSHFMLHLRRVENRPNHYISGAAFRIIFKHLHVHSSDSQSG